MTIPIPRQIIPLYLYFGLFIGYVLGIQYGHDLAVHELFGLRFRPARERRRLHNAVYAVFDRREKRIGFKPLDKVVIAALLLDHSARIHGMTTYGLVELLSVATRLDALHEHCLGGHERKFRHDVLANDLVVDDHAACDIGVKVEDADPEFKTITFGLVKEYN